MRSKKTISARIPVELTAVENLAIALSRSKSWVITASLNAMIEARERRHQAISKGLADVDAGCVVRHADVLRYVDKLKEK
ncbi:CopG family ribbon-helix-helix protein [Dickeya parazeae]|uniref:CopG family ribbon-helix-helix protein n=1 Tax=Dickeya parazeae TaxID=2893572 RepID=UPI001AED09E8|nr:transcriptional regulator [Dickeya parazeae]MBP2836905.1 transcriptional regulator [Dickeya parazeae]